MKCLADYQYEQQPWFTQAWPFVNDTEPDDTGADDDGLDELLADPAPGEGHDREGAG